MSRLNRWGRIGISLDEAVRTAVPLLARGGKGVGLFQGVRRYLVGLWNGREFTGPGEKRLDLPDVYEARVFSGEGELRWWNDPRRGCGRAAYVSEGEGPPWDAVDGRELTRLDENVYILWGKTAGPSEGGWTVLHEARIGTLEVPVEVRGTGCRVGLKSIEYVGFDEQGNARVLEERYLGLEDLGVDEEAGR